MHTQPKGGAAIDPFKRDYHVIRMSFLFSFVGTATFSPMFIEIAHTILKEMYGLKTFKGIFDTPAYWPIMIATFAAVLIAIFAFTYILYGYLHHGFREGFWEIPYARDICGEKIRLDAESSRDSRWSR